MDKQIEMQLLDELEIRPEFFPDYRFVRKDGISVLGVGGSSSVYEVQSESRRDRCYALKIIGLNGETIDSAKFMETVRIQMTLSEMSDNILRVIEGKEYYLTFDSENHLSAISEKRREGCHRLLQCVLMEKAASILQEDRFHKVSLLRRELSDEGEIIRFAEEIGNALCIAHRNQILHRDIKLENIFWDENSRIYKLGDFGMAKDVSVSQVKTVVYSDGYAAPEILTFNGKYSSKADIYSFGVVLYLLLNDLCFPGSTGYYPKDEIQYNEAAEWPAPKHGSAGLKAIIRKMCSYDVSKRYDSIIDVLADLQRLHQEKEETIAESDETVFEDEETVIETQYSTETVLDEDSSGLKTDPAETKQDRLEKKLNDLAVKQEVLIKKALCFLPGVILLVFAFEGINLASPPINVYSVLFMITMAIGVVCEIVNEYRLFLKFLGVILFLIVVFTKHFSLLYILMLFVLLAGDAFEISAVLAAVGIMSFPQIPILSDFILDIKNSGYGWAFFALLMFWIVAFVYLIEGLNQEDDSDLDSDLLNADIDSLSEEEIDRLLSKYEKAETPGIFEMELWIAGFMMLLSLVAFPLRWFHLETAAAFVTGMHLFRGGLLVVGLTAMMYIADDIFWRFEPKAWMKTVIYAGLGCAAIVCLILRFVFHIHMFSGGNEYFFLLLFLLIAGINMEGVDFDAGNGAAAVCMIAYHFLQYGFSWPYLLLGLSMFTGSYVNVITAVILSLICF